MTASSRRSLRWPLALMPLAIAVFVAVKATAIGSHDPKVRIAAAGVAIVLVWLIAVVPPSWSLCAALVLTMFGGNWQQLGLPSSVAPDRIVLGLTLVAMAVRAPSSRERPVARFRPLYALMYIGGAYAIGSAIAVGTIGQHTAIFNLLDRMQLIDWIVFILAPCAFRTAADRRVLLGTLVGMGLYLGFTTMFEIIGPHRLVFPRYIENPKVGIQFGRGRGPFVQSTLNGLALYACLLGSILAFRSWTGGRARAAAVVAIGICTFALLLTFQRTVWLGVGVSALVTMIVVPDLRRVGLAALVMVAIVVGGTLAALPSVRAHVTSRAQDSQTVRDREALDAAALNMVAHKPLFGFGWNTFVQTAPNYYQTSDSYAIWLERPIPVHDVYLAIATELGLVGLALWLPVMLIGVGGAVVDRRAGPEMRDWRLMLGALLIMWLVIAVSSPLGGPFAPLILWLAASVIVGASIEPPAWAPSLPRAQFAV